MLRVGRSDRAVVTKRERRLVEFTPMTRTCGGSPRDRESRMAIYLR